MPATVKAIIGTAASSLSTTNTSCKSAKIVMLEDFNIEEMKKTLVVKALNATKTIKIAAHQLGISERTLHHTIRRFNIQRDEFYIYSINQRKNHKK